MERKQEERKQEERKRRRKKRREGGREGRECMKREVGWLWGTDRHWNVHSLWWEEERLNTLDNQHSSNHSTRTPNISLFLSTRTCTAKLRHSPLHVPSLCLTICYTQYQDLIFHLSSMGSTLGSVFLFLPLYLAPSLFILLSHAKSNCQKRKKKKLLESDNCGSLRYIPIRKGDTCRCRGSRAEL